MLVCAQVVCQAAEEHYKMDACFEERLCKAILRHPQLYNLSYTKTDKWGWTPGEKWRKCLGEMEMPVIEMGKICKTDM